jgi:hypothetical protein
MATVLERRARSRAGVVPAARPCRAGLSFFRRILMRRTFALLTCIGLVCALALGVAGCITNTKSGDKMESKDGKMEGQDGKMSGKMSGKMDGKMDGDK